MRPEAIGGLIHIHKLHQSSSNCKDVKIPEVAKLTSALNPILRKVREHNAHQNRAKDRADDRSAKYDSYLLPMAFPEGSPMHPSYGAGHATVGT